MHRLYEKGDISVFWDSDKCFHSKKCVTSSPGVFEFGRRPWIDLSKADTKEIWQTIEKCPSGALSCVYNHDVSIVLDTDKCCSEAFSGTEKIGECDYRITEDGWVIFHTEVSESFVGRGIAKRLVYKVTEAAEKNKANVIPTCSYAAHILKTENDR